MRWFPWNRLGKETNTLPSFSLPAFPHQIWISHGWCGAEWGWIGPCLGKITSVRLCLCRKKSTGANDRQNTGAAQEGDCAPTVCSVRAALSPPSNWCACSLCSLWEANLLLGVCGTRVWMSVFVVLWCMLCLSTCTPFEYPCGLCTVWYVCKCVCVCGVCMLWVSVCELWRSGVRVAWQVYMSGVVCGIGVCMCVSVII